MNKEIFTVDTQPKLVNAAEGKQVIQGVAITYGQPSKDLGGYVRMFRQGCFAESPGEVFALAWHDDNHILARTGNGSLRVTDSPEALTYEFDVPTWDTQYMGLMANGMVTGCSVGVNNTVDNWQKADDGMAVREIVKCDLLELSSTAYPAFNDTSAELVRFDQFKAAQSEPARPQQLPLILSLVQRQAELVFGAGLTHDSKTADDEPKWSDVDKTKLPRDAFADEGEVDKKSSWSYPHHFVRNGGKLDDDGVFTTGTLFLHKGGLNAAFSAAQGGRSGQKASAEVLKHLQAHRKALGLD